MHPTPLTQNNEMVRSRLVKSGTYGASRISSFLLAGCLIFVWSRPAFPDEERHLKLAPILLYSNVFGNIGYSYLSNNFGTSRTAMQGLGLNVNYSLHAKSYFWQPWFAQVTGGLGVDFSSSISSYGPPPATSKSANTRLTGDTSLDLLKYSRFPFLAHVYKDGNHASGSTAGINSDYSEKGFDLTQKYRSLSGNIDGSAFYTHSTGGRTGIGTEQEQNQLNLDTTMAILDHQSIRISGAFLDTTHPITDDHFFSDSVRTNHIYQPNSAFSVATQINMIKTGYTLLPGASTQQRTDYDSQQLYTYASWRPIRNALTVTSSVRLFNSELNNNGLLVSLDETNFNLGANYAWSRLLRTYASINVYDTTGIQTVSTNASLSAGKTFGDKDTIILGGYRYSRYVGLGLSTGSTTTTDSTNASTGGPTTTTTTSEQNLATNFGHSLSKTSKLGEGSLTTQLDQRFSELVSTRHTPITHLYSGGSMLWRRSEGKESTYFRLNATDSRDLTGLQTYSQFINLQASRNVRLIHHQTLTGNLTIQTSRSGAGGVSNPYVTTPGANLSYRNDRLLAIKNLTFHSNLYITGRNITSSNNANPLELSASNSATASWDNDLNYFIGRLQMRLTSHLAEVNNGTESSLLFTLNRSF